MNADPRALPALQFREPISMSTRAAGSKYRAIMASGFAAAWPAGRYVTGGNHERR